MTIVLLSEHYARCHMSVTQYPSRSLPDAGDYLVGESAFLDGLVQLGGIVLPVVVDALDKAIFVLGLHGLHTYVRQRHILTVHVPHQLKTADRG